MRGNRVDLRLFKQRQGVGVFGQVVLHRLGGGGAAGVVRGGDHLVQKCLQLGVDGFAVAGVVQKRIAAVHGQEGLDHVVVSAAHHGVHELDAVDVLLRRVLRCAVAGDHVEFDAQLAQVGLDHGDDLLRARLRQGVVDPQAQALSVLFADAVRSGGPAGVVEKLARLIRVKGVRVRLLRIAQGLRRHGRGGQRVGIRQQDADDLLAVDPVDDRLAHADVLQKRVVETQRQLVVHAVGGGGDHLHALVLQVALHRRGDRSRDVGLAGQQRAGAHGLFRGQGVVDAVDTRAPLVLKRRRRPVVVLAGFEHQVGAQGLAVHHERAGADDVFRVTGAELLVAQLQRGISQQARVVRRRRLRKARRRRGEVKTHRVLVDDLTALVVGDLLRDVEQPVLVAQAEQVEVVHDVLRGHGRAVGVGHVGADVEGEHRGVLIDLRQVRGNPRLKLQRLRVLVEQPVRQLVDHAAVGVEPGGRRVQAVKPVGLQVGEHVTVIAVCRRRASGDQAGCRAERKRRGYLCFRHVIALFLRLRSAHYHR